MKVLRIHAWAVLPDDFSGSLEDALRHVADYRPQKLPEPSTVSAEQLAAIDKAVADLEALTWPVFHEAVVARGAQQQMTFSVHTLSDGAWTREKCTVEAFVPVQVAPPPELQARA